MGFFSQQYGQDDDCIAFFNPMIWRLEDLTSRLRRLVESRMQYYSPIRLSEDDLRYSIPESLVTIYDVERAIEIQKEAISEAIHNGYYSSDEIEELFSMMNTINVTDEVRDIVYEDIEIAA